MFQKLEDVFSIPELRKRIFFTLFFLFIYRIGTHVPTPGIDGNALSQFFAQQSGNLFGFFDMFTGGALSKLTVFGLGIMPYISAAIIIELLTVAVPHLAELKKRGAEGREKITKYTRYGTVGISLIQGMGISIGLEGMAPGGIPVVMFPGWGFRLVTTITLTAGTVFLMWLGEKITEKGIGNGISLLIFAGIVSGFPNAVSKSITQVQSGNIQLITMIIVVVIMVAVTAAIVFMEISSRQIPIQYVRKGGGFGGRAGNTTTSYLPLKLNPAGVIPIIFAMSIIAVPSTLASFSDSQVVQMVTGLFRPSSMWYYLITLVLIIFFTYFYTSITFNPDDIADNINKSGGVVPGKRPGAATAEFIDYTLSRLTFVGSIYLAAVALLPQMIIQSFNVPFYFGGTSLLIVIGVGMDVIQKIEAQLVTHNYDGFLKKGRIKGRKGGIYD